MIEGVRDFLLRSVRENGMKKPWQKMNEGEQTLEIERATERAEKLVTDIVDIVASGDFPVVHAIIDNYQSKNGEVKIVAKGVADDEVILNLHHAGKKAVKIVIADRNQFDKGRSNLKAEADQPDLPGTEGELEDEGGDFDETDEPKPTDSDGNEFNDAAEQAAGDAVLETAIPETGGVITEMIGFPEGPIQAMRNGVRLWSANGEEWRLATDEDVLPEEGRTTLEFDPDEKLPGLDDIDGLDENEQEIERQVETDGQNGNDDDLDPPAEETAPDADLLARQQDQVAETGANPVTGELPLNEAESDEIRREGAKARIDGRAPKANPHPKASARYAVWADAYNAQKKSELKEDKGGDADFDS